MNKIPKCTGSAESDLPEDRGTTTAMPVAASGGDGKGAASEAPAKPSESQASTHEAQGIPPSLSEERAHAVYTTMER